MDESKLMNLRAGRGGTPHLNGVEPSVENPLHGPGHADLVTSHVLNLHENPK
jgi:hypothetical protein